MEGGHFSSISWMTTVNQGIPPDYCEIEVRAFPQYHPQMYKIIGRLVFLFPNSLYVTDRRGTAIQILSVTYRLLGTSTRAQRYIGNKGGAARMSSREQQIGLS